MSEYTKGEWYPALLPNKVICRPMLGDDAVVIASVGGRTAEETQANAGLISAAPNLLNACTMVRDWILGGYEEESCGVMETVMNAIAKAEGSVP